MFQCLCEENLKLLTLRMLRVTTARNTCELIRGGVDLLTPREEMKPARGAEAAARRARHELRPSGHTHTGCVASCVLCKLKGDALQAHDTSRILLSSLENSVLLSSLTVLSVG